MFLSTFFYLGFLGPRFLIPLPLILRTDHCIFMQLGSRIRFIYFLNTFNFWSSCYDIDVIYIHVDVTIFKTKGNIFETMSSYDMTLVTSHVIPNIFFGKGSLHKSVKVDLLRIL